MNVENIFVDGVDVLPRRRPISERIVKLLSESIKEIGLQNPIQVYLPENAEKYILVAGRHRLEAIRALDEDMVDAIILEMNDLDRELWEIDENLIRSELTKLERGKHLSRRKEIFEAKGGECFATHGGGQEIGFAQDTADKTGESKSSINKQIKTADAITDETEAVITGTPAADSGVALKALAGLAPDEQKQAVERIEVHGETAREAAEFIKGEAPDPDEKDFESLRRRYLKVTLRARGMFLDWLDSQLSEPSP